LLVSEISLPNMDSLSFHAVDRRRPQRLQSSQPSQRAIYDDRFLVEHMGGTEYKVSKHSLDRDECLPFRLLYQHL